MALLPFLSLLLTGEGGRPGFLLLPSSLGRAKKGFTVGRSLRMVFTNLCVFSSSIHSNLSIRSMTSFLSLQNRRMSFRGLALRCLRWRDAQKAFTQRYTAGSKIRQSNQRKNWEMEGGGDEDLKEERQWRHPREEEAFQSSRHCFQLYYSIGVPVTVLYACTTLQISTD